MTTQPTYVDGETSPDEVRANRAAWLAALRSGNYPQTRRALRTRTGYCCLGVAEEVVDCDWESVDVVTGDVGNRFVAVHRVTDGEATWSVSSPTALTPVATRLLGLVDPVPRVAAWNADRARWTPMTLVELNDEYGFSLPAIADVVADQGDDWDGSFAGANELARRRNVDLEQSGGRPRADRD